MIKFNEISDLAQLYQFFDCLFEQDVDADTLFASSYVRGIISYASAEYGDEQQKISTELVESVTHKINQAKAELSPQDSVIVNNFWLQLQAEFTF